MDLKKIKGVIIGHQKSKDHDKAREDFDLLKNYETMGGNIDVATWNMLINLCEKDLDLTYEVFEHIKLRNQVTENSYTSMIKSLCEHGQFNDGITLLNEMIEAKIDPHLRTFLPFFSEHLSADIFNQLIVLITKFNLVPTFEMFGKMIRCSKDIGPVDTEWFKYMLGWINERYNSVPECMIEDMNYALSRHGSISNISPHGECERCSNMMKKFDFLDHERLLFLEQLGREFKNIESLKKYLSNHKHFDVIVDGANVSMFNNSPFNGKKVESVVAHFTGKGKKVLVVFNIHRKKQVSNLNFNRNKSVDVFYSDSGHNDDLFWLYCGIYYRNSLVVTDDKMCDHIYNIFNDLGLHIFKKWSDSHVVRFKFSNNNNNRDNNNNNSRRNSENKWLKIIYPKRYSEKVQFESIPLHVPVHSHQCESVIWYCFGDINDKANDKLNNNGKRERSQSSTLPPFIDLSSTITLSHNISNRSSSISQSANEPTTNRSTNQSTNQSTNEPTTNQSTNEPKSFKKRVPDKRPYQRSSGSKQGQNNFQNQRSPGRKQKQNNFQNQRSSGSKQRQNNSQNPMSPKKRGKFE